MKRVLGLAVVAMLMVGISFTVNAAAGEKVLLCHFDNGGEGHLVYVSDSSVDAHLAHGDIQDELLYDTDGDICWAVDTQ